MGGWPGPVWILFPYFRAFLAVPFPSVQNELDGHGIGDTVTAAPAAAPRSLQQGPDLFGRGVIVEVPSGVPGRGGDTGHSPQPALLSPHSAAGRCHRVPAVSPKPPSHRRAFRSPSVLVEGWSFKTLMQPFI